MYPVSLIRVDDEGEPVRDENGLCIKCEPGEPGEFVGKIVKGNSDIKINDIENRDVVG